LKIAAYSLSGTSSAAAASAGEALTMREAAHDRGDRKGSQAIDVGAVLG